LRPGHFIKFTDRVYYQIIVNKFAHQVDKKLHNKQTIFSHRLSSSGGRFFSKTIESWKRFNKKSDDLFDQNKDGFLLKTDISAYFEHIIIEKLISILSSLDVKKTILDQLSSLLNAWHDKIGIPQGYDASSFLSNVYLHEVDDAMIKLGFTYYRYADDIRVFVKTKDEARLAIEKITELFRPLNLHLSGGKTKIINYKDYIKEKNEYADDMEAINYAININRHQLDDNFPKLKKIWKDGVKAKDKTLINFCVYRFQKIKSDYPLNTIIKMKMIEPSFTPIIISYLELYINRKRVQLMLLDVFKNTPYIYQKVLILRAMVKAKKIHFNINEIDKNIVYQTNNFLLIGYFFIFIAKFGTIGEKNTVKIDYENRYSHDDKISRYFLIALKHYDDSNKHISTLLRTNPILKVTAKYLKKNGY
jgi:hypothetical protein